MEVEEMNEEHKEKSCNRLGKEFEGIVYDVKKAQMNMQRDADYSAKYRYRTQRYPEKEKYLRIQIQRSKGFRGGFATDRPCIARYIIKPIQKKDI